MTTTGTTPPSDDRPPTTAAAPAGRPPLRRPRARVLGGVCAAVATHLDVDVAVVRLAAIVAAIMTGGVALLVYLAAWTLIPQDPGSIAAPAAEPAAPDATRAAAPPARDAWRAVGSDLRTLGASLRPLPPAPADRAGTGSGPLSGVDAALTGLGERLRDPDVRARARRTATGMGTAISASLDDAGRRRGRR